MDKCWRFRGSTQKPAIAILLGLNFSVGPVDYLGFLDGFRHLPANVEEANLIGVRRV